MGGFFSAERRKVKEELDEDGVEQDGEESSEGVGECVADGVSSPFVEDMAECRRESLSVGDVMCRWRN